MSPQIIEVFLILSAPGGNTMECNKREDCRGCGAYDGNASPTYCKVMNAEIRAWNAIEQYYKELGEDKLHG